MNLFLAFLNAACAAWMTARFVDTGEGNYLGLAVLNALVALIVIVNDRRSS